jgi:hypothetical protein
MIMSIMIVYFPAEDVKALVNDLVRPIPLPYIDSERVLCYRSRGIKVKKVLGQIPLFFKDMAVGTGSSTDIHC